MAESTNRRLALPDLKPADILVSTARGAASSAIRVGTGSAYSHSALYEGDGYVIEALANGVVRRAFPRYLADNIRVSVYRRTGLTSQQASIAIQYAKVQFNAKKQYDYAGVGGAITDTRGGKVLCSVPIVNFACVVLIVGGLRNISSPEKKFYCSELVYFAFRNAGAPLGGAATMSTPESVVSSQSLEFVGTLL